MAAMMPRKRRRMSKLQSRLDSDRDQLSLHTEARGHCWWCCLVDS